MGPNRIISAVALAWMVALASACGATRKPSSTAKPEPPPPAQSASKTPTGPDGARAVQVLQGTVVEVNPKLRFVVVDFGAKALPSLEQRLSVYRLDQKVGELRVSGPFRGSHAVADITAGEAAFGDFVRLH